MFLFLVAFLYLRTLSVYKHLPVCGKWSEENFESSCTMRRCRFEALSRKARTSPIDGTQFEAAGRLRGEDKLEPMQIQTLSSVGCVVLYSSFASCALSIADSVAVVATAAQLLELQVPTVCYRFTDALTWLLLIIKKSSLLVGQHRHASCCLLWLLSK